MNAKLLVWVLSVLLAAIACDKNGERETEKPSGATEAQVPSGDMKQPVAKALADYERIRGLLAKDETTGVATAAASLASAATNAASAATAEQKPHLESMAKAAEALKNKSGASIEEIRKAFGELSRSVVALLATDPALRKGRHVFECPMAEDYKKWVQTTDQIENPYMGKKMLECGGESEWEV